MLNDVQCIQTAVFNVKWQEISAVLVSLGLLQAEVDRLEAECWRREVYRDVRHDWMGSVTLITMAAAAPSHLASSLKKTMEPS